MAFTLRSVGAGPAGLAPVSILLQERPTETLLRDVDALRRLRARLCATECEELGRS